jgi:peptidoglycan/xylan/chitin deacetylase (PgdA/CDA1 family)
VTLADVRKGFGARRSASRSVAVTFDDGYDDTVADVLPALERTGVPATVFVTTGPRGREFWWDELAEIFGAPVTLPPRLTLAVDGRRYDWDVEANPAARTSLRRSVLLSVAAVLQRVSACRREELIDHVRNWSAQARPHRPTHRSLTNGEIERLAASPLIEIGSHSVSHPMLAFLPQDDQQREIVRSRSDLEEITGRRITSFSYPHGSFSESTTHLLRDAGYTTACCSRPDVATPQSDPLTLPRFWVDRHDPERFERWLTRWMTS